MGWIIGASAAGGVLGGALQAWLWTRLLAARTAAGKVVLGAVKACVWLGPLLGLAFVQVWACVAYAVGASVAEIAFAALRMRGMRGEA